MRDARPLGLRVCAGTRGLSLGRTVGAHPDVGAARTSAAPPDQPARFRQVPIVLALGASAVVGFAAWPLTGPLIAAVAALGGVR